MINQNNEDYFHENMNKSNYSIMIAEELALPSKEKNNYYKEKYSKSQKNSSSLGKKDYLEKDVLFYYVFN